MERFKHAGLTVTIEQDQDCEAPDNSQADLFLITTRNRYFQPTVPKGFDIGTIKSAKRSHWLFPLFMYQHSGTTLSLSPFSCPWDSGQVGFVLVERRRGLTGKRARMIADSLVFEWNQYLSGDVWQFTVEAQEGPVVEVMDSCGGFYGFEYAKQQAIESAGDQAKLVAQAEQMVQTGFAL